MFEGLDVDPLAMHDVPHFLDAFQEAYDEVLNVGRAAETETGMPTAPRAGAAWRSRCAHKAGDAGR